MKFVLILIFSGWHERTVNTIPMQTKQICEANKAYMLAKYKPCPFCVELRAAECLQVGV